MEPDFGNGKIKPLFLIWCTVNCVKLAKYSAKILLAKILSNPEQSSGDITWACIYFRDKQQYNDDVP